MNLSHTYIFTGGEGKCNLFLPLAVWLRTPLPRCYSLSHRWPKMSFFDQYMSFFSFSQKFAAPSPLNENLIHPNPSSMNWCFEFRGVHWPTRAWWNRKMSQQSVSSQIFSQIHLFYKYNNEYIDESNQAINSWFCMPQSHKKTMIVTIDMPMIDTIPTYSQLNV